MAFAARATPEIKPPPLMGTIIVSISGTCSRSSRDTVP